MTGDDGAEKATSQLVIQAQNDNTSSVIGQVTCFVALLKGTNVVTCRGVSRCSMVCRGAYVGHH